MKKCISITQGFGSNSLINSYIHYIQFINLSKTTGHVTHQEIKLLNPTVYVMQKQFKLLNPIGYVMHQQFNL